MEHNYIHIKTESINNNCPECFSTEGLQITFKQKIIDARLYKTITNDISNELKCIVCDTDIYPVSWTKDIDRVVTYKKKALTQNPKSFKLKRLAWILLISIDLLIILGILIATGVIKV